MKKRMIETLTDAIYVTVHFSRKPLRVIAEENGMSENYLTRSALPFDEEGSGSGCHFPLKKLIGVVRSADNYAIPDFIEAQIGRVAIKLPDVTDESTKDISRITMQSIKEFGELMGSLDSGLVDGRLSKKEKARIAKEGYEAQQAITMLLKKIEEME